MSRWPKQGSAGFTLVETLLSIVIMGIILAIGLPLLLSFNSRNDLSLATQSVASALRRAETYARSGKADSVWSVANQAGSVTIYKGSNFATRDTTQDEVVSLPGSIKPGDTWVVTFQSQTGYPVQPQIITLSSTNAVAAQEIRVSEKGQVAY